MNDGSVQFRDQSVEDLLFLTLMPASVQREFLSGRTCIRKIIETCTGMKTAVLPHLRTRFGNDPFRAVHNIIESSLSAGVSVVPFGSAEYPRFLSEISDPPLVLFVKGGHVPDNCISVVGTRKSDPQSEYITGRLCSSLVSAGYTIVSGMAVGIDRAAHTSALNVNAVTVGICANGPDVLYPRANADLFDRVGRGLVLVSEYPPGIRAGKWAFAKRNRIISGISRKSVIVKASRKSGAMITARYAADQGRDVYACPGVSFDTEYEGCISLINSGAMAVFDASTITGQTETADTADTAAFIQASLYEPSDTVTAEKIKNEDHPPSCQDMKNGAYLPGDEIYSIVAGGCITVDEIVTRTGMKPSEVLSQIMQLSIAGRAELIGDRVFIR